ncbi:MAG: hypothetical protein VX205_03040 [Pseudomonadota bacterium]|nr:hypothetical protein [Pseudomonadota bacterium]MEC8033952.1 hypothetical protein [Pseudomonadota bacterium]
MIGGAEVAAEIAALKALVGVRSDTALAAAMRVNRATVCMWRQRNRVPEAAKHRARMMVEHGQVEQRDTLERIASEIAMLHDRLQDMRKNPLVLADDLERLASRARAIGGAQ